MYAQNPFTYRVHQLITTLLLLLFTTVNAVYAATLEERAVYTIKILPAGDAAEVGQCSAFAFGDISDGGSGCLGGFIDNTVPGAPSLTGGDGIASDGLAGSISIETSKADASGNNTFSVDSYQMDPYLGTPGGTFKTTMTAPDGALNGSGTVNASGTMTIDVTGRTGVAQFFEGSIGIQPWNVDDSARVAGNGDPVSNAWELFTTSSASNFDPSTPGATSLTLTGRAIGDANNDTILDAVLVSVGNVGMAWQAFDGTPYSEAFNIQFELVSAKPVANPDSLNTTEGNSLDISEAADLLANDTHATGDTLSVINFTQPTQAGSTVVDNNDGTLTYTPAGGFSGIDTFTYTVEDTSNETDTATVTIFALEAGTSAPVANDFPVSTPEDTPRTFDPTTNDTDADGDALTIFAFDGASVEGGTVVSSGGNSLTYTPPALFNGPDSLSYTIYDGRGGADSATVMVTVSDVNNAPVCADVQLSTGADETLTIDVDTDLLSTCTDADGDTVTLDSTTQPTEPGSTLSDNGAGTLKYTPANGFTGQDTFTYTATDGIETDTRTVTVDVGKILGNFTMLDAGGSTFGGTNDVAAVWDGTLNTDVTDTNFNMEFGSDSDYKFFGFVWKAHDIRVFGPGSYTFDTSCSTKQLQSGIAVCGGGPFLTLDVGPGQIGAHVLFDWNTTDNIDVALQWDQNDVFFNEDPSGALYLGLAGPTPPVDCEYELVSRDGDGDGVAGYKMVDGPFIDFRANFNLNLTRNCGEGAELVAPKSTIKSSDPGGCTLSSSAKDPLNRSDLWLLLGLVGVLGAYTTRRRRLDSGMQY